MKPFWSPKELRPAEIGPTERGGGVVDGQRIVASSPLQPVGGIIAGEIVGESVGTNHVLNADQLVALSVGAKSGAGGEIDSHAIAAAWNGDLGCSKGEDIVSNRIATRAT